MLVLIINEVKLKVASSLADEEGNVSLLACPLQHSIDSLLDGAEVYYLGDYFQSFSFCPCARGSARHYWD